MRDRQTDIYRKSVNENEREREGGEKDRHRERESVNENEREKERGEKDRQMEKERV